MNQPSLLAGVKALLVEDEAFIAMAIVDELTTAGIGEVEHVLSLSEAVEVIDDAVFDVAILDLRLPDGTTNKLARTLTERKTPVIFHSGHADVERLAADFPAAKICQKPCQMDDFIVAIQDLLDP